MNEFENKISWAQIVYSAGLWHIDAESITGVQLGADSTSLKGATKKILDLCTNES